MKTELMNIRKKAGYKSREIVAEMLDMSVNTYIGWERGRTDLKASDLCMLADFFDCSVDYLLGREHVDRDNLDPDERAFHALWTDMTPQRRKTIRGLAEDFIRSDRYTILLNDIEHSNIALGAGSAAGNGNVVSNKWN